MTTEITTNKSFIIYTDYKFILNFLSNEEKGELLSILIDFAENNIEPIIDNKQIKNAFDYIKNRIVDNQQKWNKEREKKSLAGKRGMEKRWKNYNSVITEYNSVITDNNTTITDDNLNVNVNDNVNVKVKVNENKNKKEEIVNLVLHNWNIKFFEMHNLSKIKNIDKTRETNLFKRLEECDKNNLTNAVKIFFNAWNEKIKANDFYKGINNRNWKMDFDFAITKSKFTPVLEEYLQSKEVSNEY